MPALLEMDRRTLALWAEGAERDSRAREAAMKEAIERARRG